MRRRCLVFEMSGARRKHFNENSGSGSSVLLQSNDGNSSSNDQNRVPVKTANETSIRVLPGIGLHLNTIAPTPKDFKIVNLDSSASRRLLIGPSSSVHFHPSTTNSGQDLLNNSLPVNSSEQAADGTENTVLPLEDACEASAYMANEEINHGSPKKKRYICFFFVSLLISQLQNLFFIIVLLKLMAVNRIFRRRIEQAGEAEACKRCNCKKSKCLKL